MRKRTLSARANAIVASQDHPPLRILALHLSERIGWAIDSRPAEPPRTGWFRLAEGGSDLGAAGKSFMDWLGDFIDDMQPNAVVFSAEVMVSTQIYAETARLLIGLAFLAETIAAMRALPCYEDSVQKVLRHCLGGSRLDRPKRESMHFCHKLGWKVGDDAAASAAALWLYAKAMKDKSFRIGPVAA
jgi:hypothetical protein